MRIQRILITRIILLTGRLEFSLILQHELIYAVETVNYSYFVDLGGLTTADINFDHGKQKMFPLMIAAAKGL